MAEKRKNESIPETVPTPDFMNIIESLAQRIMSLEILLISKGVIAAADLLAAAPDPKMAKQFEALRKQFADR